MRAIIRDRLTGTQLEFFSLHEAKRQGYLREEAQAKDCDTHTEKEKNVVVFYTDNSMVIMKPVKVEPQQEWNPQKELGKDIAGIRVYTLKELAQQLGVTERSLFTYIKQGKLKAVKIGGRHHVTADNVIKFIGGE